MARARKTFSVQTEVAGLNLRSQPSMTAQVIRVIPNGEKVKIDTAKPAPDGWVAIEGGGFVMSAYLV